MAPVESWPNGQFSSRYVGFHGGGYQVTCREHGVVGSAIDTAEFGWVCTDHYVAFHGEGGGETA